MLLLELVSLLTGPYAGHFQTQTSSTARLFLVALIISLATYYLPRVYRTHLFLLLAACITGPTCWYAWHGGALG